MRLRVIECGGGRVAERGRERDRGREGDAERGREREGERGRAKVFIAFFNLKLNLGVSIKVST